MAVIEPILQLLPTEPHEEPSAVILGFPYYTSDKESFTGIQPLDAGELISAWCNIQFLSAQASISQLKSVEMKTYFLGMIRGPQSRLCWFKSTKTSSLNHMGFPYDSSIEDCFTGIQAESGRVTEFISCNRMETSFVVPHYFVVKRSVPSVSNTGLG
ncbi:hypothetical protein KOW79_000087 [Hemibagrus wyckioides]|uniref:Uncharacterized protein n=1 Tax=Hemibagrus wyckioides TaxID=337641 RepID=A0A9D3N2H3_9TELE|nr:hypothetical protein KOW79_000087 [Hemibagrus wyckioides]